MPRQDKGGQKKDWREQNRAMWDGTLSGHLKSPVYDVEAFRQGALTIQTFEVEDMGDVRGKSLVHLQCHFGLDTLSWARLGAEVTGLDFSGEAMAAARRLADETGLSARFVTADVYDAPAALGDTYDIVYTGVGALPWLPDMDRWARVVRDLLKPGGELYLFEFHPVEWMLDEEGDGTRLRHSYFTPPEGYRDGGAVTYAGGYESVSDATSVQWNHPLGEVVTALIRAGLTVTELRELDRNILDTWDGMVETEDGLYAMPPDRPSLPFMYVLRAIL